MLSKDFLIDYAHGNLGYRLMPRRVLHEPLAKVIDKDAWVFDATGGILKDALMMALLGCKVWTCEAHPYIAEIVQRSLENIKNHPVFEPVVSNQELFKFFPIDSLVILEELSKVQSEQKPDIVYLDPMFAPKQKSSVAKKEMQWLQEIHARTQDKYPEFQASAPSALFAMAREVAQKRIVVKRSLHAPYLVDSPVPSFSKKFQSARFDIYLTKT